MSSLVLCKVSVRIEVMKYPQFLCYKSSVPVGSSGCFSVPCLDGSWERGGRVGHGRHNRAVRGVPPEASTFTTTHRSRRPGHYCRLSPPPSVPLGGDAEV